MKKQAKRLYIFGSFKIDADDRVLFDQNGAVALTPKAFDTLLFLVENSGRVLSRDEIMAQVWPDSFVEENNLAQNISTLRKVLGPTSGKLIETVPKRGYRFVGDVVERGGDESALLVTERTRARLLIEEETYDDAHDQLLRRSAGTLIPGAASSLDITLVKSPETMYAKSGNVNIAYQVVGDAPLDLVFVMGWVSHLEYFWKEPTFARFLSRLASFARLILFDKRGTGLSDRVPNNELPTLEQRMDDVRAVMDAAGSERAALCGVSEGGPMCSLFAATYPEKTLALVMIGTYAKRVWDEEYPWAPTAEQRQHFFEEIRQHWGGPVGVEERAPSRAKLVELPGQDHLPFVGDQDSILDEVEEFLTGVRHQPEPDTVLATILYMRIVAPEELAPHFGKDRWDDLLRRLRGHVQKEIDWFRGREIDLIGDRPLAIFDGPARAIKAACAISQYASRLGVKMYAGLHTGECDVADSKVTGLATEVCLAIANKAGADEVLVSSTVKDLVAGSGIRFIEKGSHTLPGTLGEWRLFAVQL